MKTLTCTHCQWSVISHYRPIVCRNVPAIPVSIVLPAQPSPIITVDREKPETRQRREANYEYCHPIEDARITWQLRLRLPNIANAR